MRARRKNKDLLTRDEVNDNIIEFYCQRDDESPSPVKGQVKGLAAAGAALLSYGAAHVCAYMLPSEAPAIVTNIKYFCQSITAEDPAIAGAVGILTFGYGVVFLGTSYQVSQSIKQSRKTYLHKIYELTQDYPEYFPKPLGEKPVRKAQPPVRYQNNHFKNYNI